MRSTRELMLITEVSPMVVSGFIRNPTLLNLLNLKSGLCLGLTTQGFGM